MLEKATNIRPYAEAAFTYALEEKQLSDCNKTLEGIRSKTSSSNESASILSKHLTS